MRYTHRSRARFIHFSITQSTRLYRLGFQPDNSQKEGPHQYIAETSGLTDCGAI